MNWRVSVALLAVAFSVISCTAPPPKVTQRTQPFDPAEYAPYDREGTATIDGQVFLKTRGGDVKLGAGNMVTLNPVTKYSTEWYIVAIMGGLPISAGDERATKYNKQTIADAQGNFTFDKLPAGKYYVASSVVWEVPGNNGMQRTGGIVHAQVEVKDGEKVRILLTRK